MVNKNHIAVNRNEYPVSKGVSKAEVVGRSSGMESSPREYYANKKKKKDFAERSTKAIEKSEMYDKTKSAPKGNDYTVYADGDTIRQKKVDGKEVRDIPSRNKSIQSRNKSKGPHTGLMSNKAAKLKAEIDKLKKKK